MVTKAELLAQVMEQNLSALSIGMAAPTSEIESAIDWLRNPKGKVCISNSPIVKNARYMFSWGVSPQGAEFWSCAHKVLTNKLGINYLYRGE